MAYARHKTTAGVYITKHSVTVAQVKPTMRGPRLIHSAQVKMKSEQPGREEIIKAIQEAFGQSGIGDKKVISGLGGREVMIRFFRMPRIPKEERKNAVKFEVKKYIPFRIEEVVSGSQIIGKKDEPKLEVIFAAVKKDYINDYLSLLQQGGLTPVALEPACLSILRILYFTGQIKKIETVAVVKVDSSGTEITVVRDGIPYLNRSLTLTISDAQTFLSSLLGEIHSSFDYYRRQFPGDDINRIILYSGRAELKDADESLSKELKIPVVKAKPVEPLIAGQYSLAEFSIAYGLAIKGLVKAQLEIELYAEEKVVVEEKKRLIKLTVVTLLPAFLVLVAIYLFMSRGVAELKIELSRVKQARIETDLVPFGASGSEIEEIRIEAGKKLGILERIIGERIYWTTKFNELPKLLPQGVWLDEIKIEEKVTEGARRVQRSFVLKGNVFLQDASGEMELLNKFLADLKRNEDFFEGFQEAKLDSVILGKSGDYKVTKFKISCSGEIRR